MSIEAMKQALQALDLIDKDIAWQYKSPTRKFCNQAAHFLRQAIEQAEKQEPLCWVYNMNDLIYDLKTINYGTVYGQPVEGMTPLYAAPPKREWVGLTEQDVHDAFQFTELIKQLSFDKERPEWCENFAAYLEAKLKEKNR